MEIPIIIVHKGDSFYLSPVLKQARLINPHSQIYLISDKSTNKYSCVEHCYIELYMDGANEFQKVYKHMSSNFYAYELFCFQRWFVIRDFIKQKNIQHFLCLDSDVLLYCNVDEIFSRYLNYDFTVCHQIGPGNSLFNVSSIEKLCNLMLSFYTDERILGELKSTYQNIVDKKLSGGICDMTAFMWYQNKVSDNVIDLSIPKNGVCFNGAITVSSGFEMAGSKKRIYWKNDLPYGKLVEDGTFVQFYCLHFQGRSKYSIFKYLLDDKNHHQSGFFYTLTWMFSEKMLFARMKSIKKAVSNPSMLFNYIKKIVAR